MSEDTSRAWKDQYMLRFPDGMRDRLKEAAAANKRSMNAEIIARLEESFKNSLHAGQQPADLAMRQLIAELGDELQNKLREILRKSMDEVTRK